MPGDFSGYPTMGGTGEPSDEVRGSPLPSTYDTCRMDDHALGRYGASGKGVNLRETVSAPKGRPCSPAGIVQEMAVTGLTK